MAWKTQLENPFFWLKKCIQNGLLKEHQDDWLNIVKTLKNSEFSSLLTSKLTTIYKNKIISKSPMAMAMFHKELFEIVATLTKNPNAPFPSGSTPIHYAIQHGLQDIVRILAPLVENPNAPNLRGYTPIQMAARKGYFEIIKILVPFSKEPNRPDPEGATPIYLAAEGGNLEIIKILAPLCINHNTGNEYETTLGCATRHGHIDIVKFLAPLCDNPNAPSYQRFPMSTIQMAEIYGHTNVVEYLSKLMEIRNSIKK
jgi:hypothetical protein